MTSSDVSSVSADRVLVGRRAEYEELLLVMETGQGLIVVSADPWSGTSALLRAVNKETHTASVLVDARACQVQLDLAMAIADTAVAAFRPQSADWWRSENPPERADELRLLRALALESIDLDDLRLRNGPV